jgi:hypothetical protein
MTLAPRHSITRISAGTSWPAVTITISPGTNEVLNSQSHTHTQFSIQEEMRMVVFSLLFGINSLSKWKSAAYPRTLVHTPSTRTQYDSNFFIAKGRIASCVLCHTYWTLICSLFGPNAFNLFCLSVSVRPFNQIKSNQIKSNQVQSHSHHLHTHTNTSTQDYMCDQRFSLDIRSIMFMNT